MSEHDCDLLDLDTHVPGICASAPNLRRGANAGPRPQ
jgi:hypothetical protein